MRTAFIAMLALTLCGALATGAIAKKDDHKGAGKADLARTSDGEVVGGAKATMTPDGTIQISVALRDRTLEPGTVLEVRVSGDFLDPDDDGDGLLATMIVNKNGNGTAHAKAVAASGADLDGDGRFDLAVGAVELWADGLMLYASGDITVRK